MTESQIDYQMMQVELMREERLRRGRQQFEYVRLNLINVGVLSLFALFGNTDAAKSGFLTSILSDKVVLALIVILTVISITLFLFWLDDAFHIAGIDQFLRQVEQENAVEGRTYWHAFRDELNHGLTFRVITWVFNSAVILAFFTPPIFLALFIVLLKLPKAHHVLMIGFVGVMLAIMIIQLGLWRIFSKGEYTRPALPQSRDETSAETQSENA